MLNRACMYIHIQYVPFSSHMEEMYYIVCMDLIF